MSEGAPKKPRVFKSKMDSAQAVRERRKSPRLLPARKFEAFLYSSDDTQHTQLIAHGFITDISPAGMGLYVKSKILLGTPVSLVIKGLSTNQTITAEVVWCKPMPTQGRIIKINETSKEKSSNWFLGLKLLPSTEQEHQFIQTLFEVVSEEK